MSAEYTDKVYRLLVNMKVGEGIIISSIVTVGNEEKFIAAVKRFIDDSHIHPDYDIQIKSDYTAIRKVLKTFSKLSEGEISKEKT